MERLAMTTKEKLRPLPGNLDDTDLGGLQNLHSEMLATCSDLAFEPPGNTLVEITGTTQGVEVVRSLHAAIEEFLKKPLAVGDKREQTTQEKMSRQRTQRVMRDASNKAKPTTENKESSDKPAAKPAKKAKERVVAKKAAKKAVAKKAAKKATNGAAKAPSADENKKISWLLKDKELGAREGSERFERRKKLKAASGKTVGAYLKAGGSLSTLNRAVEEKAVKLA
jgi:hypothetical protein